MQFGEICAAFMNDDHFAVDDGLARDIERAGDRGEAFGPIETVTGESPPPPGVDMKLDAVAVVFDLMQPVADGHLGFKGRKLRLMKPGIWVRGTKLSRPTNVEEHRQGTQ